ncbi:hypothetical protein, partial [uncultured Nostoc sp.]|uniref:hypothetical protein n=1 Tax=uncultured Nostoc sp. TaxID=340711 RepID=UPI0035CB43D3
GSGLTRDVSGLTRDNGEESLMPNTSTLLYLGLRPKRSYAAGFTARLRRERSLLSLANYSAYVST